MCGDAQLAMMAFLQTKDRTDLASALLVVFVITSPAVLRKLCKGPPSEVAQLPQVQGVIASTAGVLGA
jgi:hypothetical protein|eukprot:COSAG01_NODE_28506_length_659_cov_1.566071_1_plen_68_part_00